MLPLVGSFPQVRGRANQIDQISATAKVMEIAPQSVDWRAHALEITGSVEFRGSRRSSEFLLFIVDRALDHHFDELKERALGVELFGREPSYDTGGDAIVRVTAREVRKRLQQFYAESGVRSTSRIDLAPGSYIPEFRHVEVSQSPVLEPEIDAPVLPPTPGEAVRRRLPFGLAFLGMAVMAVLVTGYFLFARDATRKQSTSELSLPWSALSTLGRPIHLIFCDPDIVNLQRLFNFSVSLSDYANGHYVPESIAAKFDTKRMFQADSFRGANVALVDANLALHIAKLSGAGKLFAMDTHTARSTRLSDFKTDDSFILLGSPRSNPWGDLFRDEMDFSFDFDPNRKSEFIRNRRPRAGESLTYIPTTQGWGTGQAYAVIALVTNPNQAGHILLIAGSSAEATEAAGNLATNPELFEETLDKAGISPRGKPRHFELLLRVSTMAGSPNMFEVIACHVLPDKAA